jgi:hypothetical protein
MCRWASTSECSRWASSKQDDGVETGGGELLDVARDGEEDGRRGGLGRQAQGQAQLAVEVAPAQGCIVSVGEAEALGGQTLAQRAQHAGFTDAGSPTSSTLWRCWRESTSCCLEGGSQRSRRLPW